MSILKPLRRLSKGMIPELPEGMSLEEVCKFYRQYWGMLSDQSTLHIKWFTHSQNPSVCWICDLNNLTSKVLEEMEALITKSTVDIETSSVHEEDSEPESESDYNEPEYDVLEEDD